MSYNKREYMRVKSEFDEKYRRAQEMASARRAELHAKIPQIAHIDSLLSRMGMEIIEASLSDGNVEKISQIRKKNSELILQREKILLENGYTKDYSDVRYECSKCLDTGYTDAGMCECMRRALVEAGYESSGLGALIKTQSFDNFSLEYYRSGSADYDKMKKYVDRIKKFAETFGKDTYCNYLIMGGTGLGKTHISTAVAKTVIERGYDVLYITSMEMISDFELKRFSDGVGVKHDTSRYINTDLLIIDDLGTEMSNQFTLSCIYDVINARMNSKKSTIISTNLAFRELESKYNERITSRLFGEYKPMVFSGVDVRRQKISQ